MFANWMNVIMGAACMRLVNCISPQACDVVFMFHICVMFRHAHLPVFSKTFEIDTQSEVQGNKIVHSDQSYYNIMCASKRSLPPLRQNLFFKQETRGWLHKRGSTVHGVNLGSNHIVATNFKRSYWSCSIASKRVLERQ